MRNLIVTGASGGLGAAVVAAFAARQDRIFGVSHPAYDLTLPADAVRAVAEARARGPLHGVIHLMGGFSGGRTVADTDDATWRRMMAMNLDAAFYLARAAVPALIEQPGGRIVMVGARAALEPTANMAAYNASKAGLVALVKTLGLELAPQGATANLVLPGVMDTPANRAAMPEADTSRWGSPAAIAELIVWLASPASAAVNATAIPV